MPICQCVCVKSISILNWSFCLAGLFFRSHWLNYSKYTNIKCYEHLLPNCLAFLTHCHIWKHLVNMTLELHWKKHQLSNCCRMAEQHHHMTKRSSNILAMTTHCMASFCPKIATSGWRRLKNLRPHGNVAKHQPAISTKPSSCSEYILHHVSSSQVDLMCYRVFSSFSKPTKTISASL